MTQVAKTQINSLELLQLNLIPLISLPNCSKFLFFVFTFKRTKIVLVIQILHTFQTLCMVQLENDFFNPKFNQICPKVAKYRQGRMKEGWGPEQVVNVRPHFLR